MTRKHLDAIRTVAAICSAAAALTLLAFKLNIF
jgi:hypothetical protein